MKIKLPRTFRLLAIGLLSLFGAATVQASHIAGTDLTYTAIPGANGLYLVTLKLYRDCGGIQAPSTPLIVATPNAGNNFAINLTLNSVAEVTDVCPGVVTECDSAATAGALPGYEEYVYTGLLTLPAGPASWTLSYSECCRNTGITNQSNTSGSTFYTEAHLNVPSGVLNSSPVYTVNPIPYFCVNDTSTYSPQAVDPDGDSLVFSLAPAMGGQAPNPLALSYTPGFTPLQPFGISGPIPTTIDPQTGLLRFKATSVGAYVLVIKIEEYRTINGVTRKVGSCQRDVQVQVTSCSTPCPLFGNVLTTGSGAFVNSNAQVSVNPGAYLQLSIPAHSTNPNVTMSMTSNCANEIPGSMFMVTGSGANLTGTFTWNPASADVRTAPYYFTYHVTDNACPVPNERYGTMRVLVTNSVLAANPDVKTSEVLIPNILAPGQSWTLPADLQGASVQLFDITGKQVFNTGSYANQFSGKGLSNGLYSYRILTSGMKLPLTGSIVLQH